MNTRRSRRSRNRGSLLGWALGGVGLLIIVGIAVAGIFLSAHTRESDKITGCSTDRYDSITAVLVDLTDPISPVQAAALRNALLTIRNDVPQFGRLEIYPLKPVSQQVIDPMFAACSPGNGRNVSSRFYGNPELADRFWHKQFADKLDPVLEQLERLSQAQLSPILEAIQSISVTAFGGPLAKNAPDKRLIIVSDMIQYTPELSMYRVIPDLQSFTVSQYYARVKTDLRGANVDVYLIVRDTRRDVQRPALYKFWVDYIGAANGYLRNWEPLQ